MSNQLQLFEQKNLQVFKKLAEVVKRKKELETLEKDYKAQLEIEMEEHGVKSIDNEFIRISYVEGSTSTSIDLKTLEEKEPKLYVDLINDYPKVTTRKPYLMFKVK